jgi:electron transfer flavoprotein beta subunit
MNVEFKAGGECMNILVCVKQVPDTTDIKINPETNTLMREGVPSIVNTFDAYALETAARIKDSRQDSKIVVLSMGPEQAKIALKECLSVGADKAYLVSDRLFSGSDTLATSYILSRAIAKVEELEGKFDVIFCGKQAIDGDTAQVGPEIAEHLNYPQLTCIIEAIVEDNTVRATRETEDGREVWAVNTPAVLTVTKTSYDPRFPSIKSKLAAGRAAIPTLTSADLDVDLARLGLKGSPTKVKKSFVPPRKSGGVVVREETAEESVGKLLKLLGDAGIV